MQNVLLDPYLTTVFYRAGFIENWGQGIQKICNECRTIGAEIPQYELIGNTLRIHFKALKSALINDSKAPKHQSTKAPKHRLKTILLYECRRYR